MPNPFEFIKEIREMNDSLTERLDTLIDKLDKLIEIQSQQPQAIDVAERLANIWYGDGK